MKKRFSNLFIMLLLTAIVFSGMAYENGSKADVHQYNYNPEETNDWRLYSYKLFLDNNVCTEEYIFIDITEYNNLTNQGVEDLVNSGYLHSYIPALIEAGRLPEGFTPTSSGANSENAGDNSTSAPPANTKPQNQTPPSGTQNTTPDNNVESNQNNEQVIDSSENEIVDTEIDTTLQDTQQETIEDNLTQSENESLEDTEEIQDVPSTEELSDEDDLDTNNLIPWEVIVVIGIIVVAGSFAGYYIYKKHK